MQRDYSFIFIFITYENEFISICVCILNCHRLQFCILFVASISIRILEFSWNLKSSLIQFWMQHIPDVQITVCKLFTATDFSKRAH